MPLSFPRKFSDGYRVENADCYADVYIYPGGHWVIGTHISMAGGVHLGGSCVNVSFVLCDGNGIPLEGAGLNGVARFGMPSDHQWCVAPSAFGGPSDRYDEICGDLPKDLLNRVEKASIVFINQEKRPDWNALLGTIKDLAKLGAEIFSGSPGSGSSGSVGGSGGMHSIGLRRALD